MTILQDSAALVLTVFATLGSAEVHRSTAARNLTAADRAGIAELGIQPLHAGGVALRKIPAAHKDAQVTRFRELAAMPVKLAPSDICDSLVAQSDGTALCTGRADGPFGDVPVRMTIGARTIERPGGGYSLVVFNTKPLEAKGLFGWTELAKANAMKLSFDLEPRDDHWEASTRMGVTMSSHTDSAERIGDVLTKLDTWLATDIARR